MVKTEFHGHGDPLFQAVIEIQQHRGTNAPEKLHATQKNMMGPHSDGPHGDPLLHEFLEYDRTMMHRHHALHLEGHGDPLLAEYAKQWGLEEEDVHAHAETELHSLGGFPEFHFQGDPLFDESTKEHHRQNVIAQKKKHSKSSDEPGAGTLLGDHIWTVIDVMKH
jgi:hypothetical protein